MRGQNESAVDPSPLNPQPSFFAVCPKGVEEALAAELTALGVGSIDKKTGGVSFAGDQRDLYRANLWLRTATRILAPVATFEAHTPEELYSGAREIPWETWLSPDGTLAVDANTHHSMISDPRYAALKAKDAVCDSFYARLGSRPSVNRDNPDLRINIHIANDRCTASLDSSGRSLNKRGYRSETARAPLRETLAAALVELSGWDGKIPFVDPMCGTGTIAIEAALIATRTAPGLLNPSFGFLRWLDFDRKTWLELLAEAQEARRLKIPGIILANDITPKAIGIARHNARVAKVDAMIRWSTGDARRLAPPAPPPGVIVANPPYGERIGDVRELATLYKELGDIWQERWKGWTAFLFTGDPFLAKKIWLKPARRLPLWNGPIECRLITYDLRGRPPPSTEK